MTARVELVARKPEIVCVDCGGRCFLLTQPREDGAVVSGDIVAYRCEDCRDRWDLVLPDGDERGDSDGPEPPSVTRLSGPRGVTSTRKRRAGRPRT